MQIKALSYIPNIARKGAVVSVDTRTGRTLIALGKAQAHREPPKANPEAPKRKRSYRRRDVSPESTQVIEPENQPTIYSDEIDILESVCVCLGDHGA